MTPTGVAPERLVEDDRALLAQRQAEDRAVVAGERRLGGAEDGLDREERAGRGWGRVVPPPPWMFSATTCTVPSSNGTADRRGVPSLKRETAPRILRSVRSSRSSTSIMRNPPPAPAAATAGR